MLELRSVTRVERCLRVDELEENDTNGPDVCLVSVFVFVKNLRCHVEWGATQGLIGLLQPLELL